MTESMNQLNLARRTGKETKNITTSKPSKIGIKFEGKDVYALELSTDDVLIKTNEWNNIIELEDNINFKYFVSGRGFYLNNTTNNYESFDISLRHIITTDDTTIIQAIASQEFYCKKAIIYYTRG